MDAGTVLLYLVAPYVYLTTMCVNMPFAKRQRTSKLTVDCNRLNTPLAFVAIIDGRSSSMSYRKRTLSTRQHGEAIILRLSHIVSATIMPVNLRTTQANSLV